MAWAHRPVPKKIRTPKNFGFPFIVNESFENILTKIKYFYFRYPFINDKTGENLILRVEGRDALGRLPGVCSKIDG
jgi:hypothetical protein